jgi:hypothetical protein
MTNLLPGKFHRNRMKSIIASLYKEIITDKMVSFLVVELNRIYTLLKLKNFLKRLLKLKIDLGVDILAFF